MEGRHLRNTAQRLQGGNDRSDLFRRVGNGFVDCLLQAGDALAGMMDFMDIVHERRFERRLLKVRGRAATSCTSPSTSL
jgi:hypothetical protein